MCFLNLVLICHLLEIYAEKNILVNDLHVENIVQAIKKINVCRIEYRIVIFDWNQNICKTCDTVIMAKKKKP